MGGTLARGFLSLDASRFSWCGGVAGSRNTKKSSVQAIEPTRFSAAAQGSDASVTARPITRRSAPASSASRGVAARAWSWCRDAFGTDAGHDDHRARRKARGVAHVGRGAHDATAATLDSGADTLREDVLGSVTIARENRDRERRRRCKAGALGTLGEPVDAGAQHRHAALSVERQVVSTEHADDVSGAVHRRRDVVQLQVEEHAVAEIAATRRWPRARRR